MKAGGGGGCSEGVRREVEEEICGWKRKPEIGPRARRAAKQSLREGFSGPYGQQPEQQTENRCRRTTVSAHRSRPWRKTVAMQRKRMDMRKRKSEAQLRNVYAIAGRLFPRCTPPYLPASLPIGRPPKGG